MAIILIRIVSGKVNEGKSRRKFAKMLENIPIFKSDSSERKKRHNAANDK